MPKSVANPSWLMVETPKKTRLSLTRLSESNAIENESEQVIPTIPFTPTSFQRLVDRRIVVQLCITCITYSIVPHDQHGAATAAAPCPSSSPAGPLSAKHVLVPPTEAPRSTEIWLGLNMFLELACPPQFTSSGAAKRALHVLQLLATGDWLCD